MDVDGTSYTTYINADEPRLGRFSIFIPNVNKQLDAVTDANVNIFHDYQANSLKISGQIHEHTLLDLFDVLGKCVYSRVIKNGHNEIDLTELNQGVYLVKLRTNRNELIKMIMI